MTATPNAAEAKVLRYLAEEGRDAFVALFHLETLKLIDRPDRVIGPALVKNGWAVMDPGGLASIRVTDAGRIAAGLPARVRPGFARVD